MRKLIVSNLATLDGYYEGKDRNLNYGVIQRPHIISGQQGLLVECAG